MVLDNKTTMNSKRQPGVELRIGSYINQLIFLVENYES